MRKIDFENVFKNPTYSGLLNIYNKTKKDRSRDKFYSSVKDVKENDIHFKLLFSDVRAIYGKYERNNLFTSDTIVDDIAIKNKPLNLGRREDVLKIQRPKIIKHPTINYDELPDDLKLKYNENGKLESEIKSRFALMAALPELPEFNDQRKNYLIELDKFEDKQGKNWDAIDNWYNSRASVPAKLITDVPELTNPLEVSNYIARARKYIKRY